MSILAVNKCKFMYLLLINVLNTRAKCGGEDDWKMFFRETKWQCYPVSVSGLLLIY